MTTIERTIYPQIPTEADTKWLKANATPTEEELKFVQQHTSKKHPELQLGLMLLLKLFQCGDYCKKPRQGGFKKLVGSDRQIRIYSKSGSIRI